MKQTLRQWTIAFLCFVGCTTLTIAQDRSNVGKQFFTYDEARQMCGVPMDSILVRWVRNGHRPGANSDTLPNEGREKSTLQKTLATISWRDYMSPVENQMHDDCHSDCWIHSATGVTEGMLNIAFYNGHVIDEDHPAIELDESEVLYNRYPNPHPDDDCVGLVGEALDYIQYAHRIRSTAGVYPNLSGVKWGLVSQSEFHNKDEIKSALAFGPVSAAYIVYQDFMDFFNNLANRTSVYHNESQANSLGGHAVVIVGYTDDSNVRNGGYWLCKNSWGSGWADGGYFRIIYDDASGINLNPA